MVSEMIVTIAFYFDVEIQNYGNKGNNHLFIKQWPKQTHTLTTLGFNLQKWVGPSRWCVWTEYWTKTLMLLDNSAWMALKTDDRHRRTALPSCSSSSLLQPHPAWRLAVGRYLIPRSRARYLIWIITQQLFHFNAHDLLVCIFYFLDYVKMFIENS